MIRFFTCCLVLAALSLSFSSLFAKDEKTAKYHIVKCSPELSDSLNAVLALEEGKALVSRITAEGPLKIAVVENSVTESFSACWDQDRRTILIGISSLPTQGEMIGSLVFELHNALVTSQYDYLDKLAKEHKIGKQEYVKGFERLEYLNSINASRLIDSGIQQGVFPKDAKLFTYKDFEEHFYYQKISGHSAIIAKNYDILMRNIRRSAKLEK